MFTRPAYHHYVIVSAIFSVLQWHGYWLGVVNCTSTVSLSHRSHNGRTNALPESTYATHTISATQWYSTKRSRQYTANTDDKRNGKPMDSLASTSKWPADTMVQPTLPAATVSMPYAFGETTVLGTDPTSAGNIINYTSTSSIITTTAHISSTSSILQRRLQRRRQRRKMANVNDVLVLVQTSNIQINGVREQFHRLIETFNVTLGNVTIDFDTIDGEYWA